MNTIEANANPREPAPVAGGDASDPAPLDRLATLLDRALRDLAATGQVDAACRIAAEGWWVLKEPAPDAAQRLNVLLHRLTAPPGKSTPNRGER